MDTAHQPNEANALRKAHKYQQAIPLYQTLWDGDKKDPWDGWGYAFCLRKTGKLSEALDVCREVYRLSPTLDVNRSLYAWCVYDLEIKTDEVHNPGRFLKAANGITQLTEQKDKYAPYTYTVFKVCKHLLQRNHAEDALEWLDRFGNPFQEGEREPEERVVLAPGQGATGSAVELRFPVLLTDLGPGVRLALEMASHEAEERLYLRGELWRLERAWREAEEIAAIADRLTVPA